jgi:AcrR family transcriptional regulator
MEMADETTPAPLGLRERKKLATRAAIAQAARTLFAARGYDAVTVAEVARAADVSEKTVFNHFPAKEDLVFAGGEERLARIVEALRDRPAGTTVLDAFRAATEADLDHFASGPVDDILVVPRIVRASPALRNRLFLTFEREAAELAPVVAEAAGLPPDDLVAATVARTLAWTNRIVARAAFNRLLAGEDQAAVVADLRREARRAFDQLAEGLGSFGA